MAEDNPVNQKVIRRILEKWGCAVAVAADGYDAVGMAVNEAFDLVLMDLEMPRMGGLEATAAIRDREAGTGRHTPIIALTAHALPAYRDECWKSGTDGFVTKPVRAEDLLRRMDETLRKVEGAARDGQ